MNSQINSCRNYMTVIRTNRHIARDGAAPYEHHEISIEVFRLKQFCRTQVAQRAAAADWYAGSGWNGAIGNAPRTYMIALVVGWRL